MSTHLGRHDHSRTTGLRGPSRIASALALAALLSASLLAGCAAKQRIPLEMHPKAVEVYVNGKAVKGPPKELELRTDRDHKVFVKSEGFRSELVVVRSVEVEGERMLEPAALEIRLAPLNRTRPAVEFEFEE